MSWSNVRRHDFSNIFLYAVTQTDVHSNTLLEKTEKMLVGGVDAVQLRAKSLSAREIFTLGLRMKDLCHRYGALFFVNDRVDVAMAVDADGIHVGHADLPVESIRAMVGHKKIIGVSTHSLPEAIEAQKSGADYVSCGPVFSTPTKPDYKPVGLELINLYHAALRVPFVVIGGINEGNIQETLKRGARTIAVVRALYDSVGPAATASRLKEKILAHLGLLKTESLVV